MIAGLLGFAFAMTSAVAVADAGTESRCSADERALAKRFSTAALAMEPEGVVGGIYDRATESEGRCADSEPIAYFRLRAAELGRGGPMVHATGTDQSELEAIAAKAVVRFPTSARIATAKSRIVGTVASAEQALALDPAYAPAKVSLAAAMLHFGQPAEARALLERTPNLGSTSDGFSVLAQAALRLHDLKAARKAAQTALTGRDVELVEPDARDPRPKLNAHETLGIISLERKEYSEAAGHLLIAADGSAQAQKLLASANPAFRRAIEKARRSRTKLTLP